MSNESRIWRTTKAVALIYAGGAAEHYTGFATQTGDFLNRNVVTPGWERIQDYVGGPQAPEKTKTK